jgi:UDP:flavonoid glycosyltransferase YjiC (YdhE family)
MNSIHEGLYYGVPLIVIPHQVEQLINARCVEAHGAAFVIGNQVSGKKIRAAELRTALGAVMSEPKYQSAATELKRILQGTGGYHQAADEIQKYLQASNGT